jgi:hypothetical protein
MSIAKLKLDESNKLSFNVEITGAVGQPETRFIIEGKNFNIAFPCTQHQNEAVVEIAGLKNVLQAGEYRARLEVVLENKIYTPLEDSIVFEPSIEVHSAKTVKKPVLREAVKVNKVIIHKTEISESELEKTRMKAALIIAAGVGYIPESFESPEKIVKSALGSVTELSISAHDKLIEMLELAEEVGISIGNTALPKRSLVIEDQTADDEELEKMSDELSDEELEKLVDELSDEELIAHAYDDEELRVIDADTGDEIDDDEIDDIKELDESYLTEILSRGARLRIAKKAKIAMSHGKLRRNIQVSLHRHSNNETFMKRSRRAAVQTMKNKLSRGVPYNSLSVAQKERIEKIISKRKSAIGRMANKLLTRVRSIEQHRLARK